MKGRIRFFCLTAFLILASSPPDLPAANLSGAWTLSPMAGEYRFEGNQGISNEMPADGTAYSLGIGYNFTRRWGAEGIFHFVDTGTEPSGKDLKVYGGRLDFLYHLNPSGRFVPYLAGGFGAMRLDLPDRENDDDILGALGLGMKVFLGDGIALRADARHLVDINVNDADKERELYNNWIYSAGLLFQLGGNKDAAPIEVEHPPPAEPGTFPETISAAAPVAAFPEGPAEMTETPAANQPEKQASQDGDGDGVPDEVDRCPNTPWGKVNEYGCPTDSDGDGVPDELDKCFGTSLGVKVGQYGCPQEMSHRVILEFPPGDADILPYYHEELKKAAEFISEVPYGRFRIEGHTDSVGPAEANQGISLLRAKSVRNYLIEKFDVSPSRLEAKGYGESRPIGDNATQEGRQQNRRVVVVFHSEK